MNLLAQMPVYESKPSKGIDIPFVCKRMEQLKSERTNWDSLYQDIKELVRPDVSDFNKKRHSGEETHEHIFDGTAPFGLNQYASGLDAFLTSDRWFGLGVADFRYTRSYNVERYLDTVLDVTYHYLNNPYGNFNPQKHEAYLDLGAFGTAVMYQDWSDKYQCASYKTFPLSQCYLSENDEGLIDTVYRNVEMSARNIVQKFGDKTPKHIAECLQSQPDKKFEIIHAVQPNDDYADNVKYVSLWIDGKSKELLSKKYYMDFPYHIMRWQTIAGEPYGRSPAMECLPDIRVINLYERYALEAAQLNVAPPLLVPHDAFVEPLNISPRGVNIVDWTNGQLEPRRLLDNIDLRLSDVKMEQRREHILRCFMADVLRMFRKKERQTISEISEYRDERLRAIAPNVARIESEFLTPLVMRLFSLLKVRGLLPPPPSELKGKALKIIYRSPAVLAQGKSKMEGFTRWFTAIAPLAQIKPEILDSINFDAVTEEGARIEGVPKVLLNDPQVIEQMRQGRQAQEQMAQMQAMAQTGSDVAGSIKDLSVAGKNVPQLIGL